MKNFHYSPVALSAIIFLMVYISSCSPVPYGNVGQNVPMLKNKGEVSVTANYANTDDANGLGIQGAVAVDSSLALMTSFYSLKNNRNTDWKGSGKYFELGAGKYGLMGRSKFVFDVFGGVGFGGIKNNSGTGSALDLNFVKPFVQGSIGLSGKWIEVALTSRFALPVYTNYKNSLTDSSQHAQIAAYYEENKSRFVFEPGITFRFGYKSVKANLSFCTSSFSLDEKYNDVSINNNYVSAGLAVLISKRYHDKE